MALSELEKKRVEKLLTAYCENKIPPNLREQIRIEYRIRGNEVSLFESRPHWQGGGEWISMKVARFKTQLLVGSDQGKPPNSQAKTPKPPVKRGL